MYVTPSWCPAEEHERWQAKKKKMVDTLEWLEKMEDVQNGITEENS
jgi:hypothetical protein